MLELIHGDCLEKLKELPDNSVDSIVTDPPYGLSFMGKKWDYDVPSQEIWEECLRVLKPGGYLLSFAGTRTQHRMAVNIEDAGFEIRDMIAWIYSTGFPKSTNIYKQFQKMCTCGNMEAYDHERTAQEPKHQLRPLQQSDLPQEVNFDTEQGKVLFTGVSEQSVSKSGEATENVRGEEPSLEGGSDLQETSRQLQGSEVRSLPTSVPSDGEEGRVRDGAPTGSGATPELDTQAGTGSASQRPQPIKQFSGEPCAFCKQHGAQEVRTRASEIYGFGSALKPACEPITVARKPLSEKNLAENVLTHGTGGINIDGCRVPTNEELGRNNNARTDGTSYVVQKETMRIDNSGGARFPANLIHDGSEEVVELFPTSNSGNGKASDYDKHGGQWGAGKQIRNADYGDKGSAARFFYCAKASKKDRDEGLEGFELKNNMRVNAPRENEEEKHAGLSKNFHPTVKPTDLMRYLCRLVTPKGGTVLDPFMGSGSTGKAAKLEGFSFIGIEREVEYIEIAKARIDAVENTLFNPQP